MKLALKKLYVLQNKYGTSLIHTLLDVVRI
jgi:hypothetical protein